MYLYRYLVEGSKSYWVAEINKVLKAMNIDYRSEGGFFVCSGLGTIIVTREGRDIYKLIINSESGEEWVLTFTSLIQQDTGMQLNICFGGEN